MTTPFPKAPGDLAELVGFACPYKCIYLAAKLWYWVLDVDFERRMRMHNRRVFAGWRNAELFVVSPTL